MIFRTIPVQQLERNRTACLQVKLILGADLAVRLNIIYDLVFCIRQGDEFTVLRGNRLIIRYDLIPDVHDHNMGLAVSGIRFFCRLIVVTLRCRIGVLHAQRIIHPDAVQIEIRAFFVPYAFIIKGHLYTVCTIRQIRIAVNGDVVQSFQIAITRHHSGINVAVGRFADFFAILQLRNLHLNIAGSRADPAIDRGAGAGEVIGELRRLANFLLCTCVHHRAVAVLPIVQIGCIRAVGAVRIITHIAGLLIDIAGSSLRLPLHRAIGILHPRISSISEVLLIVHGGSGDDGDRACCFFCLTVVAGHLSRIGQLFNAVQRLGQRIGDGLSVLTQFSFAVVAVRRYINQRSAVSAERIVGQDLLHADLDRQAIVHHNGIVLRQNRGIFQLRIQIVGADKGNAVCRRGRPGGSHRHTGGAANLIRCCFRTANGTAPCIVRGRIAVRQGLLHMVAAVLANLHIELCGLVVFQRKRTAAGGGSRAGQRIVLVIDVIGLIGYSGVAVEQGKREVNIVDRSPLTVCQIVNLNFPGFLINSLGLGDLLGNGNRILLGQVELDAAVGAALTAVHVINGQSVIALRGKAGKGGVQLGGVQIALRKRL